MKHYLKLFTVILLCFSITTCVFANSAENLSDRKIIKQIKKYNKKIKRNNNSARLYLKRGYLKFCLKDYKSAIEDFTTAQSMAPTNVNIYYLRGRAWYERGNYQDAMEDFNKAIELKKHDSKLYISRGLLKDKIGEYDSAIDDYTIALKYNKHSGIAYINRGIAKDKSGKPIASIGDYQRAIKVSKEVAPQAYYNMGLAQCKREQYEDAVENFSKAIELNSIYSDAYYNRGKAYIKLNHLQYAKFDFEKAVQYNHQNTQAREALKNLNEQLDKMYDTTLPDWMLK